MLWLFITYALIGGISLLFLILIMAIGGLDTLGLDMDVDVDVDIDADMDVGGGGAGGPGFFSLPFLLAAMSSFGGVGLLALWAGVPPWLSPFVAVGGSAFIIVIVFVMVQRFLQKFISDSTVNISSLKGTKGTVSVPIIKGGEGQIVVITEERGRMLIGAVAGEDIPANEDIVILESLGDSVKVMPLAKYRTHKATQARTNARKHKKKKGRTTKNT